jgi:hypothetical protein
VPKASRFGEADDEDKAMISKIVSGGQTGVDRAALDFAIMSGVAHGGFCPKGRRSETGRIPDKYNLTERSSPHYLIRTALNVQHSDGTLTRGDPEGGTLKTVKFCIEYSKPKFIIDLQHGVKPEDSVEWVRQNNIRTLNVAGPRESKQSGIGKQTEEVLAELLPAAPPLNSDEQLSVYGG